MWFKIAVHRVFAAALVFAALAAFGPARAEPSVGSIRLGVHSDKLRVVLEAGFSGYCGIEFGGYEGLKQSREKLARAIEKVSA